MKPFSIILLICYALSVSAQNRSIDSLQALLNVSTNDTLSCDLNNQIAVEFRPINSDTSLLYAAKALVIAKSLSYHLGTAEAELNMGNVFLNTGQYKEAQKILINALNTFLKTKPFPSDVGMRVKKGLGNTYNTLGNVYYSEGDYDDALRCHENSLKVRKLINDEKGMAFSYNNIALICSRQGNYGDALKNHFESLKIKEKLGNKKGAAISYNNIGLIYKDQSRSDEALKNLKKALSIAKELKTPDVLATCYINIASIYVDQKRYDLALRENNHALEIGNEYHDEAIRSDALGNIGNVYYEQGKYKEALDKEMEALKLKEELEDAYGACSFMNTISRIYEKQGKTKEALKYGEKALALAFRIKAAKQIEECSGSLIGLYKKTGDYRKAYEMQDLSISIRDSILSSKNTKELIKQEINHRFQKQALADSINYANKRRLDDIANEQKLKAEKNKMIVLICGLALSLVAFAFIFNRFRVAKKQKNIIEMQGLYLSKAHSQLEEKSNEIKDSILYAKEIQNTFLKSLAGAQYFPYPTTLVYQPKDIVSGDFYWYKETNDTLFVAVGDSTGHGVPGAIISVLAIQTLEKLIANVANKSELHSLNKSMKAEFNSYNKRNAGVSIGLDYSIICISKAENKLYVSGSGQNVYVKMKNGKLDENKFDSINIGGADPYIYMPFTAMYSLEDVDAVIMFSDGIIDQKGGPEEERSGKKYGSRRFRDLIMKLNTKDNKAAEKAIETEIREWKGEREQLDDITVLALQIGSDNLHAIHKEKFITEHSTIPEAFFTLEADEIMNQHKLEMLLHLFKHKLKDFNLPMVAQKRAYAIIVEAMENAMRHSSKESGYMEIFHKFIIGNEEIEMFFGNFVRSDEVEELKKHLSFVKEENKDNLKKRMYEKASDGMPLSEKGGAGVGIFDMLIRSNGEFSYKLISINEHYYYLTQIRISYGKLNS